MGLGDFEKENHTAIISGPGGTLCKARPLAWPGWPTWENGLLVLLLPLHGDVRDLSNTRLPPLASPAGKNNFRQRTMLGRIGATSGVTHLFFCARPLLGCCWWHGGGGIRRRRLVATGGLQIKWQAFRFPNSCSHSLPPPPLPPSRSPNSNGNSNSPAAAGDREALSHCHTPFLTSQSSRSRLV